MGGVRGWRNPRLKTRGVTRCSRFAAFFRGFRSLQRNRAVEALPRQPKFLQVPPLILARKLPPFNFGSSYIIELWEKFVPLARSECVPTYSALDIRWSEPPPLINNNYHSSNSRNATSFGYPAGLEPGVP